MPREQIKDWRSSDPQAAREQQCYERPVPSRELLLSVLDAPMTREELQTHFGLEEEVDQEGLYRRLRAMLRDGQLVLNRRQGYCVVNERDLIRGRILAHRDGFGFIRPEDGSEDLFLSPRQIRGLLHNDRVVARVTGIDRKGRREAAVVECLERHTIEVVGRYYQDGGIGIVVPDDKRIPNDILIPNDQQRSDVQEGQIVLVRLDPQAHRRARLSGQILEILGEHMAPGMEIDIAIHSHNIPVTWPAEVAAEIANLPAEVPESALQGRTDLRTTPLITIDGEDAKDFDDAVFCEPKPKGWRLLVAIADVAAYVTAGSALDQEARLRGNSVYFPGRVVPMLPEALSNGLCSLNPHVDRLCRVCEMYISRNGRILRSTFYAAVMRSQARLTYTEAAAMLVDKDVALCQHYADVLPHLQVLHQVYNILRQGREQRGAIDFETTETRIVFGADRKINQIVPVERNNAHRLIEEAMIAANICAARYIKRHKLLGLFRVHIGPTKEKGQEVRSFLGELSLQLGGGDKPNASDYSKLLCEIKGRPDAHLIQVVLLRSLSQAVYSPQDQGHFGLALEGYAHFTSPIRRYPDLVVHRAIAQGASNLAKEQGLDRTSMAALGEQCSATERRADEATRDVHHWLKCEYMQDRVGEEFPGIITGVTSFGLFVEMQSVYVDGLVHITALPRDYYHFDPVRHCLRGERHGKNYRLADALQVKVVRVDLDDRKIDLVPVIALSEPAQPKQKSEKKRRKRRKGKQ